MNKYLRVAREMYKANNINGGLRMGYIKEHNMCNPRCTISDITECNCCCCDTISDEEVNKWADENPVTAAQYLCTYFCYLYEDQYYEDEFLCPINDTVRQRMCEANSLAAKSMNKIISMMDNMPGTDSKEHEDMWAEIQHIMYKGESSYTDWKWYAPVKEEAFKYYTLLYYSTHGCSPYHVEYKYPKAPETTGRIRYIRGMSDRYDGTYDEYYADMNSMLGINGYGSDDSDTWEPQDPRQVGGFTMYDGGWD